MVAEAMSIYTRRVAQNAPLTLFERVLRAAGNLSQFDFWIGV
jgi:hypothetical protein